MVRNFAMMAAVLSMVGTWPINARADWPTLHGDLQRSGYTARPVAQPITRKWYRSFVEEMIGPRCEAIVAERLCFVGTYAGRCYALRVENGETAWQVQLDGPIGHSPCYRDGTLYVAADVAADRGELRAIRAANGAVIWRYDAPAGFWNSPACDGKNVYIGDRAGVFHAVDTASGKVAWTFRTGAMILKPASISADGKRIVLGSEDMHVYCLSPDGRLIWKSAKLNGLSQRDAAPTIWTDKVVIRTNPPISFHQALYESRRLLSDVQRAIPARPDEDAVFSQSQSAQYLVRHTVRRAKREAEAIAEHLTNHPEHRTWHTLNLADGKQPWIAPVLYTGGLHNPPSPPTFNRSTGALYTIIPTALSPYCDGVSQLGISIGKVDALSGEVEHLVHRAGDRVPGYHSGMVMIADETSALSLMGDYLLTTHQGALGGVDLASRRIGPLVGVRDSYGGLFGPGAHGGWDAAKRLADEGFVQYIVNEWHGPDRSIVAVDDGRLFWIVGGCVVCLGGPNAPEGPGSGPKPPAPWRWSVPRRFIGGNIIDAAPAEKTTTPPVARVSTPSGGGASQSAIPHPAEQSLPLAAGDPSERTSTPALVEQCEPYIAEPPEPSVDSAGQRRSESDREAAANDANRPINDLEKRRNNFRDRLNLAIDELIGGESWAPWYVQLGISGHEYHFNRKAETLAAVAASLPHLRPETRRRAVTWLDDLVSAEPVLDRPCFGSSERRREFYDFPQSLQQARESDDSLRVDDCYGLWAYAHYADRWDRVLPMAERLQDRLGKNLDARIPSLDGMEDAALNRRLAGLIGYIRIMRKAQRRDAAARAAEAFAAAAAARVELERTDGRLHRRSAKRLHYGNVPRYVGLVPEIGRLLSDHSAEALRENLAAIDRELPVWHHAWGERLVGGENYTNPPDFARGVFVANAYGRSAPFAELARRLDQPWCKADVYYIERLTALLAAE